MIHAMNFRSHTRDARSGTRSSLTKVVKERSKRHKDAARAGKVGVLCLDAHDRVSHLERYALAVRVTVYQAARVGQWGGSYGEEGHCSVLFRFRYRATFNNGLRSSRNSPHHTQHYTTKPTSSHTANTRVMGLRLKNVNDKRPPKMPDSS